MNCAVVETLRFNKRTMLAWTSPPPNPDQITAFQAADISEYLIVSDAPQPLFGLIKNFSPVARLA